MTMLSLDASTSCTGWAVFKDNELIDCGKIKPSKNYEWRNRIILICEEISNIIHKFKIDKVVIEDVPLNSSGMHKTTLMLGVVQGMIMGLCNNLHIPIIYVNVSKWRSNLELFDHTNDGKKRDALKIASINKANEIFGLNLKCEFSKSGKYNGEKSDDDIADAILIGFSQLER